MVVLPTGGGRGGAPPPARVFEGFERKPVERPAHRWVVVDDDHARAAAPASAGPVELEGQEPAA
ncbi:hypothetical protein BST29_24355 [Mycobacterium malmoense]|uniref:Uncharacterized protein n=1 Tax=Mycobacterium malmoense TaxID=1780 RepID=A0ABX3SJY5_MYCMA|nr:hypothetical protein BST29_24355 [Mycobacterium malmoense]